MRTHSLAKGFIFLTIFFIASIALSETRWSAELFGGTARSFSTSLTIRQSGNEDITLDADYETRPLEDALYYAWRISRWSGQTAWEVELVHHKLYLQNVTPEVQHFEVSHGYNLLLFSRAWEFQPLTLHIGAGPVIAHVESILRGESSNSGYSLTGPAFQVAAGKRFFFGGSFFLAVEAKFTIARARVKIPTAETSIPNLALHGLVGFGFAF